VPGEGNSLHASRWPQRTIAADLYCGDPPDEICWRRAEPLVLAGLGAHRDRGGEPRPRALCEKLPTYARPLLLYAQEIEPHTGWRLGSFPQVFSRLALTSVCVHLIREDGRVAAGQVNLTDAPSPSRPVWAATIDKPTINMISR
jgi:hypothetical protein